MSKLTSKQITTCAKILAQLIPGFLPLEIFDQIARLVCLPGVVVVPLKRKSSSLDVGLVKRDENDRWWPNMWHLPGTVLLSTDTVNSAIKRLMGNELLLKTSNPPVFHGFLLNRSERGAGMVLIYTIENCSFQKNTAFGWFSINKLPKNFITSEKNVIDKIKSNLSFPKASKIL